MVVIRMLATGTSVVECDEYLYLGESTTHKALRLFCQVIIAYFEEKFLRIPTASCVARLLVENDACGFTSMLGSINCMHWIWKNNHVEQAGLCMGWNKKPIVILEVVVDKNLWIWDTFFGLLRSVNVINVLH